MSVALGSLPEALKQEDPRLKGPETRIWRAGSAKTDAEQRKILTDKATITHE